MAVVGGVVFGELVVKGIIVIVVVFFLMLIYIWFCFEWQYLVGVIVVLIYDVIVIIGFFLIIQMMFDLVIVVVILIIVGYLMNDIVVVYDCICENLCKYKKLLVEEVFNFLINDMFLCMILIFVIMLLVLFVFYFIGGLILQGFLVVMIWGVLIGIYLFIFVVVLLLFFINVNCFSEEDVEVVDFQVISVLCELL